jgi:hypothetical protein
MMLMLLLSPPPLLLLLLLPPACGWAPASAKAIHSDPNPLGMELGPEIHHVSVAGSSAFWIEHCDGLCKSMDEAAIA